MNPVLVEGGEGDEEMLAIDLDKPLLCFSQEGSPKPKEQLPIQSLGEVVGHVESGS